MNLSAYIAVFGAVLIPAFLYFGLAYRERQNILDIRDFFPLKRSISTGEYRSTTIAAGMSLATVIIAFINLAPFLGITLFVSVISYSASFLLLYRIVIKKVLTLLRFPFSLFQKGPLLTQKDHYIFFLTFSLKGHRFFLQVQPPMKHLTLLYYHLG